MAALPDVVLQYSMDNWSKLGYNPILVYRLLERGWSMKDIDDCFKCFICEDWDKANVTYWLIELEKMGFEIPPDDVPVVEFLDRVIFAFHADIGSIMT